MLFFEREVAELHEMRESFDSTADLPERLSIGEGYEELLRAHIERLTGGTKQEATDQLKFAQDELSRVVDFLSVYGQDKDNART